MSDSKFEIENLLGLLRRPADHPSVIEVTGRNPSQIERSAYMGFVALKPEGLSVMFKEAPWLLPAAEVGDPSALHVCAFHLHRDAHEGYTQYAGHLLGDVVFGDTEAQVIQKLGAPAATGGGGMSKTLKRPIPRWLRYFHEGAVAQFQLDAAGRVEMFTLYVPDVQGSQV